MGKFYGYILDWQDRPCKFWFIFFVDTTSHVSVYRDVFSDAHKGIIITDQLII